MLLSNIKLHFSHKQTKEEETHRFTIHLSPVYLMQPSRQNGNDDTRSNSSSMTPQVHHAPQAHMQSLRQAPCAPAPIRQLNELQDWQHQQSNTQARSQGQLSLPIPKTSSSTSLSVISSSSTVGTAGTNKTKFSRGNQHQVQKGSGVDIKGPTPEVAQQLRFPWKLHLLLERCEYEHQQKLAACVAEGTSTNSIPDMPISWLPDGKSFKVHDKERFVREVMPSFFGTQSFKTFQRNLNLWYVLLLINVLSQFYFYIVLLNLILFSILFHRGFTRVSKGPQKDVCSHPLFLKGFPAVCQSMKRIVLKGTGRGNRAPLGGVDVSSVQAVVAAAAMQQAQQQQQQQAQKRASAMSQGMNNQMSNNSQTQQVFQQQQMQTHQNSTEMMQQQNLLSHIQQSQQQSQQQQMHQNQQQQFVIENGSIVSAPMPSQQKLVVLPTQPIPNATATTTVMWPNVLNQPLQQQQMKQQQQANAGEANANLHKSLQHLSTLIQQINGCNTMAAASVNTNTVHNNGNNTVNTSNFQPAQQIQTAPAPSILQQPPQQPVLMQQQVTNPNTVQAPAPMSTQDLVALLLQRNLQQQVTQVQASQPQQTQTQVQLQVPTSLFQSGNFSSPQPITSIAQQQTVGNNHFAAATSPVNFTQPQQQQQIMGNNGNLFQQQPQVQQVTSPQPAPNASVQQQQNQLLQLLLQQSGWSTSSSS